MVKAKAITAAVALAAAATAAQAGIWTLGTSNTVAPTANPTLTFVLPSGAGPASFTLYLWAVAQGTGYLQQMQVGAFASTSPSWNGGLNLNGQLSNNDGSFVTTTIIQGVSAALIDNTGTNQFLAQQPTAYINQTTTVTTAPGYFVPFGISGTNLTAPPGAVRSTARALAVFQGTVANVPGTYYLYLGRRGGGVNESPAFFEGPTEGGNTTRFGFGDGPIQTTGRIGNQTTGIPSAAEAVSNLPDAILIVQRPAATNPAVFLTPGGSNPGLILGSGDKYIPGLANGGVFQFQGTHTGNVIVAFDIDGETGVPAGLELPSGATLANSLIPLFEANLGGTFDFVVNFGPGLGSGPFTAGINNLRTLARVAAIPEPAALGVLAPVALLAARRRKA